MENGQSKNIKDDNQNVLAMPTAMGIAGFFTLVWLIFGIAAAAMTHKARKQAKDHKYTVHALWTTIVGWLLPGTGFILFPAAIGLSVEALKK